MTRKDYELLAEAVAEVGDTIRRDTEMGNYDVIEPDAVLLSVVYELKARLLADNPRFDGDRFERACGVESWLVEELDD